MALEKTLGQKTDATGTATETLKKYSTDYTMLAFRNKSGKAELHEKFADFYFVVEGQATLVTGGQIVNGKPTAPGEVRGDSIQDGKETKLKKGDIVHIPANIPHQLIWPTATRSNTSSSRCRKLIRPEGISGRISSLFVGGGCPKLLGPRSSDWGFFLPGAFSGASQILAFSRRLLVTAAGKTLRL